jgi:glycosyltransferase involved in cell wall biosynthesis
MESEDGAEDRPVKLLWYWPFARPEELDWARSVAERGNRVTVVVIDREGAPVSSESDQSIGLDVARVLPDVDRSTTSGPRWLWSRARTYVQRARVRRRVLREGSFDVVHYHYLNRFTDAWRRPEGLWVASIHDVSPHRPRLGALEDRLARFMYRRPDGLIVHHQWLRQALEGGFGVAPGRIRVVPHQVFPVVDPCERAAGESTPTILFFGALRQNKGLDVLLAAIERAGGAMRLHIAGRGDQELELLAADAAKWCDNVTTEIGRITEMRKAQLFRACNVVALPYTAFSSQSGVLHDAYGHWRPVVATDVGALGQTVRDDGTGLVVPAGDVDRLAEALLEMCGPHGDRCAAAARTIAVERSPRAVATATVEAYEYFASHRS